MSDTVKRGSAIRNLVIIVAVVAVVIGWRFSQLDASTETRGIRATQLAEGYPVETVRVRRGDLERWITLAGTVEGEVQYAVESANALKVEEILVAEGDVVAEGQALIRLTNETPTPMYHSLGRARALYEHAERNVERMRNLFAEGAVSRSALDDAETALATARSELDDARSIGVLRAAEAGVVSSILVEEGEMVPTYKPLVWILATDRVKVRFEAGSGQAAALKPGQLARWTDDAGTPGAGEIVELDRMADPTTHLLAGEARFDNADGRLVPGLLLSFQVRVRREEDALILPAGCVEDAGGEAVVWVVDDAGKARRRSVSTGLADADHVVITAGLAEGETVVRHGPTLLSEGAPTRRVGVRGEG